MSSSIDVLAYSNPVLGGLTVNFLARGYSESSNGSLPLDLAYVGVPLILTPRDKRQKSILAGTNKTTGFLNWLDRHPEILPEFGLRARRLKGLVDRWVLFGARYGLLSIDGMGILPNSAGLDREPSWPSSDARGRILLDAKRMGIWFANAGAESTIFAAVGVRP